MICGFHVIAVDKNQQNLHNTERNRTNSIFRRVSNKYRHTYAALENFLIEINPRRESISWPTTFEACVESNHEVAILIMMNRSFATKSRHQSGAMDLTLILAFTHSNERSRLHFHRWNR